ncbi:MAG: S8 family serine peptidase [Anaerolineae bacterium]|nr:S8 family serine peptidase [Anaerolineae bacterium]
MKRYSVLIFIVLAGLLLASLGTTHRAPALAQTPAATAGSDDISIEPENPKATKAPSVIKTPPPDNGGTVSVDGTPVPANPPAVNPPTTFDELLNLYPDLKPFIDSLPPELNGTNLADLYKHVIQIYKDKGAEGVATFLKDSGILDKMGIPVGYIDLLLAFGDKGDIQAVEKLARQRQLINSKDEVIGYLALDSRTNEAAVRKSLEELGVSAYRYLENTEEIEIGIPLAILGQYKTPGPLLEYLTKIGKTPHVVGFRPPTPATSMKVDWQALKGKGAAFIGADKWHQAGVTGKGVRIGILDFGFGQISSAAGKELPEADQIQSNTPLEDLEGQDNTHGTACAIIVHAAAPDAELYIAYFDPSSEGSLVDALEYLIKSKVQIVSASIGISSGPRDGTWGFSPIVDQIVSKYNILWVNSAGNEALNHTSFVYKDNGKGVHAFSEKLAALPFVPLGPTATAFLNWNGNWNGGEKNEYQFKIVDKEGNEVATAAEAKKGRKNDFPYQVVRFEAEPKQVYFMLVSKRTKSAPNATMDIFISDAVFPDWAIVPDHSVVQPGDANGSYTVGATGLTEDKIEEYSSQGPTTDDRIKPDITAPTGEKVMVYKQPFFGTSGSAPLVAGAAGLVLEKFPEMSPEEVRAFLNNNAKDLGDEGPDPVFGAGRVALPDPGGVSDDDPGTTKATPVPDDKGPVAEITNIDTKFNVKQGGQKGMAITLSFTVDNFKGKKGIVAVLFYDAASNKPIQTNDPNFRLSNGSLAAIGNFTAKSDKVAFDDAVLFIPNSAFSKLGSGTKNLYYVVIIADPENLDNPLAVSDKVNIKFKK